MFYMNHDDIEGLFRDAAENYQMNTDMAFDWEKVQKGIHEPSDDESKPIPPPGKDRKRFIFWIFLFISIAVFSYNVWYVESHKPFLSEKDLYTSRTKEKPAPKSGLTAPAPGSTANASAASPADDDLTPDNSGKSVANMRDSRVVSAEAELQQQLNDKGASSGLPGALDQYNGYQHGVTNFLKQPWGFSVKLEAGKNETTQGKKNRLPDTTATVKGEDTATKSARKAPSLKRGGGFYAGMLFSPDFTFVKFQKTQGVGTTFGAVAGYQLTKHFSIETGLLLDTKKYYTKGEYFDKSHIPYLQYAKLVSVDGNCNMFEIPLDIRYNFSSGNAKQRLTAAIGTSTYLMTKEYYHYSALSYGQWREGAYDNHASSTHLFAVINLSAGYERQLPRGFSLRAEPYFKIPVKGIGTGNLLMTSTGINIGITKYFGKK